MDNVQSYYDQSSEKEWNRLATVSQFEYFVTKKILSELTSSQPQTILDLGGGPGRYAIELSKQEHEVTLVDISEANLSFARKKAEEENVTIASLVHASSVDLNTFPNDYFDLALSLGPMYHLTNANDIARANEELLRVMKPGAYAIVAFITKLAVLRDVLHRGPERLIEYREHYDEVMQSGVIVQPPESGFTDLRLFNASEIKPMMTEAGFIFEKLIGCEGPMNLRLYDTVHALSEREKNQIFDSMLQYSEWPSLLDSSDHILFIGMKPETKRSHKC